MNIEDFKAGTYKKGYNYQYFLPEKVNQEFYWADEVINQLLESASLKLGALNSFSKLVPDTDMFIIMHIFKEAVVSSRIEGTQTNIEEAFNENTKPPITIGLMELALKGTPVGSDFYLHSISCFNYSFG